MKQKIDTSLLLGVIRNTKIDYKLFNEIVNILGENIDNHTKANLIIDAVKDEIEQFAKEVYEEGYYDGIEYAEENYESDELDELRDALDRIADIANGYY